MAIFSQQLEQPEQTIKIRPDHSSLMTSKTEDGIRLHDKKISGKWINYGYVWVYKPTHHFARKGAVREHRLVWEEHNKASLLPWTDVHHINGDRADNRPENLEAMMKGQHTRNHNLGTKHSEETKRKIGLKSIGRFNSEETRRKKGKKPSEETKRKISESVRRTKARMKTHSD